MNADSQGRKPKSEEAVQLAALTSMVEQQQRLLESLKSSPAAPTPTPTRSAKDKSDEQASELSDGDMQKIVGSQITVKMCRVCCVNAFSADSKKCFAFIRGNGVCPYGDACRYKEFHLPVTGEDRKLLAQRDSEAARVADVGRGKQRNHDRNGGGAD